MKSIINQENQELKIKDEIAMKIQVTPTPQQNLLGGPENMVTELKTSIFIALFGVDKARVALRG